MATPANADFRLPRLHELGMDLLVTTARQRRLALARPFVWLAAYVVVAALGFWWLTPVIVAVVFAAVVTVAHDVVHNSLWLSRRRADWALFCLGGLVLASGHAYRTSHLAYHHRFPGGHGPAGQPANLGMWAAVPASPLAAPRLWWWAYRQQPARSAQRRWLLAEALWPLLVLSAGVLLWSMTPAILVYALLVSAGSVVYALLAVARSPRPVYRLPARLLPTCVAELAYHLEHHLYPQVPSHNLPELARRLTPLFQQAGIPSAVMRNA